MTLLVDADAFSDSQIRGAIKLLEDQGSRVKTLVFAAPKRAAKVEMKHFLSSPSIHFRPVERGTAQLTEPNDARIMADLRRMAKAKVKSCVAVMTADGGFAAVMRELALDLMVLMPETSILAMQAYASAGIPILELPREARPSKVRAILDIDGNGRTVLAQPFNTLEHHGDSKRISALLDDHFRSYGWSSRILDAPFPAQLCAKLGFANRIGPLTVWPAPLAVLTLHEALRQVCGTLAWREDIQGLAFFLPLAGLPKKRQSKTVLETYGSALAQSIFLGGGPFILKRSDDLVILALRRLGYLDDDLNQVLAEALTCFLNTSETKKNLRKLGVTIHPDDRSDTVARKLHGAFLSHDSDGRWRRANASKAALLQKLRARYPQLSESSSPLEMLEAMKDFAVANNLPLMRSFNGLAWQMQRHMQNDPQRRALIEIKP